VAENPAPSTETGEELGIYVWRGGHKIPVEKQADRFTVIPASPEALDRLRSAPGVRDVKPVTNHVYKVETTAD
jgi:hypothetical protein